MNWKHWLVWGLLAAWAVGLGACVSERRYTEAEVQVRINKAVQQAVTEVMKEALKGCPPSDCSIDVEPIEGSKRPLIGIEIPKMPWPPPASVDTLLVCIVHKFGEDKAGFCGKLSWLEPP